jgi:hypothetical protein
LTLSYMTSIELSPTIGNTIIQYLILTDCIARTSIACMISILPWVTTKIHAGEWEHRDQPALVLGVYYA